MFGIMMIGIATSVGITTGSGRNMRGTIQDQNPKYTSEIGEISPPLNCFVLFSKTQLSPSISSGPTKQPEAG